MNHRPYWENGAYAEVVEEAGGLFSYMIRFDGWHIERKDMDREQAEKIELYFLRSEAAFGPMSDIRRRRILSMEARQ